MNSRAPSIDEVKAKSIENAHKRRKLRQDVANSRKNNSSNVKKPGQIQREERSKGKQSARFSNNVVHPCPLTLCNPGSLHVNGNINTNASSGQGTYMLRLRIIHCTCPGILIHLGKTDKTAIMLRKDVTKYLTEQPELLEAHVLRHVSLSTLQAWVLKKKNSNNSAAKSLTSNNQGMSLD